MINLTGSYLFRANRRDVWPLIFDPNSLIQLVPGCQQLNQISENEYKGVIQVGIASVSGIYETYVRIVEAIPYEYCHLHGDVSGGTGTINGEAKFNLMDDDERTFLQYEGSALITGALATMNPRFLVGVIQALVRLGMVVFDRKLLNEPDRVNE